MIPTGALPGLLLTTLVPGWLLVRALRPEERIRDPLAFAEAATLAIAFSVAITIVVGSALGFAPHGERGLFRPFGVALGLVAASAGLFLWGLSRGAYPRLLRRVARKPRAPGAPTKR